MKKTKFGVLITSVFLLSILLIPGCKQPTSYGVVPAGRHAVSAQVIIDELESNLLSAGFTPDQIDSIIAGASSEVVTEADLSSTDLYNVMPFITVGAIGGLSDISFPDDDFRIMVLTFILESLTGSLDGREVQSPTFNRAVDPNADVMRAILAGITAAAIKSLDTAGVDESRIADAAGATIGTLVDNMDDAGVTGGYVGDAAGDLVKAAVEELSAVIGDDAALQEAVEIVSGTAVETLVAVDIDGFDVEDIPAAVGSIAGGIVAAIDDPVLIGPATSGIAQAAAEIISDPVIFAGIVEAATTGATEGLGENTNPLMSDLVAVFGEITAEASEQFASAAEDAGTLSESEVIDLVITGASEGAANVDDDALDDAAEIKDALVLSDSDGNDIDPETVPDIDGSIDSGIAQSDNELPVINSISDKSVESGSSITITASVTDPDGDNLSFAWFINSQPASDGVFTGDTTLTQAVFGADTVGEYILRLEVSDGKDTAFSFITVNVTVPLSLVARDRIDFGLAMIMDTAERDYDGAMAQFSQVTSSAGPVLYAEAQYWQAFCLYDQKLADEAEVRYQSAITAARSVSDPDAFKWDVHATSELATIINRSDRNAAITMINDVISLAGSDADHPDGEWISEAYHKRGNCYFDQGDYTSALADFNTSRAHPDVTPRLIMWNTFQFAHIKWKEGNLSEASADFLALARDTDFRNRSGVYNGLVLYEMYNGIRWSYSCAGWSASENGISSATTAGYYNEALGISGSPDIWVSWFNNEKGWRYKQEADSSGGALIPTLYPLAEAAFTASVDAGPDEFSDYARLILGWLYNEWSGHESQVLQAYLNAFNEAEDPGIRIRAGVSIGEHYMWNMDDNDAAITQFNTVLSMNTSDYPVYEAQAIQRLGHAWMRKGWDADDGVGTDYIGFFNMALGYLEQITLTAYPELVNDQTWLYTEALSWKAKTLQELDRENEALTLLQSLVSDDSISDEDKARFQYDIGRIYFNWGRDFQDDGDYSSAMSRYADALTAYNLVIFEGDGRWKAEAVLDSGDVEKHKGWVYEDEGWSGRPSNWETLMDTAFTDAITYFQQITTTTYPDLPENDDWIFFEASCQEAEALSCRNDTGDMAAALAILEDIENVPGYREEEALRILSDIARIYENFAEDYSYGEYDAAIRTNFENAAAAYQDVIDESVAQGHPDDGEQAGNAYQHKGWMYYILQDCIWYSIADDPVADFPAVESDYSAAFNSAEAVFTAGMDFKPSGFFPHDGMDASSCQMRLGELYTNNAWRLRDRTVDFENDASAVLEYYNLFEGARTQFELFLAKIDNGTWSTEGWAYSEELQQFSAALFELIRLSDAIGGPSDQVSLTDIETYLNRVYVLMARAAVSPEMQREHMAAMYNEAGRNLTFAGDTMHSMDFLMDIGTSIIDADWSDHYGFAEFYFEQVIDNFTDVDGGEHSARAYFFRGELYKHWAEHLLADNRISLARTYYQAALADFDRTKTGGSESGLVDDWMRDDSGQWFTEITGILAAPPFI